MRSSPSRSAAPRSTGGRFSLVGSVLGALIIQTLTSTIYSIGVPPEINLVVKARGRVRRHAAAVGRVPRDRACAALALARCREARANDAAPAIALRAGRRGAHKFLPLRHHRAVRADVGAGSIAYDGFFSRAGVPQPADRQRLPRASSAIGMTFVILSGGIDLSVGSVIALTTMVSATLVEHHGWSPALVIPLVLVDRHRVRRAHGLADPALPAAAVHRHAGRHVPRARALLPDQHRLDQHHRTRSTPAIAQCAHPAVGRQRSITRQRAASRWRCWRSAIYLAHFTRFGRTVYAIGGNEQSALLMGLPVRAHRSCWSTPSAASARRWPASCSRSTCCRATACTRWAWSSTRSPPW